MTQHTVCRMLLLVSIVTKIKILTINNIKQILSDAASITRTEPYSLLLTSCFSSHVRVKLINAIWQTEGKFSIPSKHFTALDKGKSCDLWTRKSGCWKKVGYLKRF